MTVYVPQALIRPWRKKNLHNVANGNPASLVDFDHAINRLNLVDRLGVPHGLPRFSTEKSGLEGGQGKVKLALSGKKILASSGVDQG